MRGKIVPDVTRDRVGCERAARVGFEQGHRHAQLGGEKIIFQKVVGHDDLAHLLLECIALSPLPIALPAIEIAGAVAARGIDTHGRRRDLARMAARAALAENFLAAGELRDIFGEIGLAARSVFQLVRRGRLQEEERHIGCLRLGRFPVGRVLPRDFDFDRRRRLAADERVEMQQPLFAEETDVEIDAVQRAQSAHRIGAVLQDARRPDGGGRLKKLRQPMVRRNVVVELLVVEAPARQRLLAPALGVLQARAEAVDRVHRARVVDVVGGDERGVERTWPRGMEQLIDEACRVRLPDEDAVDPEILRADVRTQILPFGIFRIRRRLQRVRPDVAEAARHADAERLYQILRVVIVGIVVIAHRVPFFRRRFVKIRIGKEPETDDAARVPVVGAERHVLPARPDLHAGIFHLVLERVRRAVRPTLVEP